MQPQMITMVLCILAFNLIAVSAAEDAPPLPFALPRKSTAARAPVITEQPKDWLVKTPEVIVRLNCRADGYPKPKISWLKDGVPLHKASVRDIVELTTGELTFLRVRNKGEETNTGTYQCLATNNQGKVSSRNASVQIASIRDEFRKEPRDTIAAVGDSLILECEGPPGIPEPDISWRKDHRRLSTQTARMQIKPGGNLVISSLQTSDSGSYECVASNSAGQRTSTAALLMVQEPPRFIVRPSDQTVVAGQAVEIECDADGDPRPKIQWSRAGGRLPERLVPLSNGNMRISGIKVEDSGKYVCTAINRFGQETATAVITVQDAPQIQDLAPDTTVQLGDTVTLPCRVQGAPTPTVFWRSNYDGTEMYREKSYQEGHLFVAANGDLIIYSARFDDQGSYVCQAVNALGSVTGETKLNVQPRQTRVPPPIIKRGPTNTSVSLAANVLLECSTDSVPNPVIRWYKEGKPIETGSSRSRVAQQSSGKLKITNIQKTDSGRYTCKASNDHGVAGWDGWLNVLAEGLDPTPTPTRNDFPRAPSKPTMVNSTSSYVTVTWQSNPHNGASPIKYYILEYYRIESASSTWSKVSSVLNKVYKVSHLSPASNYVFVLRTVNQQGVSDPSPISDYMRTKDIATLIPPSPPSDSGKALKAVAVDLLQAVPLVNPGTGTGSIRLKWETASGCGVIDGFMVVAQPVMATNSKLFTEQVLCRARTFDLTDIPAATKYEVRIRPFKGQLSGIASPIVFVSLEAGIINAALPTLEIQTDSKDENKLLFLWQPPTDLPAAFVSGYALTCRSRDGAFSRTVRLNSSTTSAAMDNLKGNTAYVATITYSTQLGEGTTSDEVEIALGAVSTDGSDGAGGITALLQQPGMMAGLIVGLVVIVLLVGGVCFYVRSRRNSKTRGLHASHRSNASRFDSTSPYTPAFEITKNMGGLGGAGSITGNDGGGSNMPGLLGQGDNNRAYRQRSPMDLGPSTNGGTDTVVTYNAKNGVIGSCLGETSPGVQPSNSSAFSYVTNQLTSKTDIPPQFSRPSLTSTQSNMQHQFVRQQSGNNFCPPNPSDQDMRFMANSSMNNIRGGSNLPPPPPSPPMSQRTTISDRSRTSSNIQSTGERSSRSGQKSRRSARGSKSANSGAANSFPTDTDTGIDSLQNTPSAARPDDFHGNGSAVPPAPPIRSASNFQYCHPCVQFDHNRDTSNLGYLGGPSEGDTDNENDRVGQLQVRSYHGNHDPRNSLAVSNVSMMNGCGSDSDVRISSYDQESIASSSSEESFHMESASQVGQSLLPEDQPFQSQSHGFKPPDKSPKRQYPNTYHHPRQCDEEPLLQENSGQSLSSEMSRNSKKQGGKMRRPKTSNTNLNRLNSASSSSSSCRHNTGDSGMSAGVGCSTDHNSLNSSASGGSGEGSNTRMKVNRSRTAGNLSLNDVTPTNQNVEKLPRLNISDALAGPQTGDHSYPSPVSPTASGGSEQSGYVSTASTCWQFQPQSPTKQHNLLRPQRVASPGRVPGVSPPRPNNLPDAKSYPNSHKSKFIHKSPHQHHTNTNPDDVSAFSQYDVTPTNYNPSLSQYQNARLAFGGGAGGKSIQSRPQELSDVPEVSTSDFCEDYSDQSQ